ncbi:MAG: DUF2892 domain-containing protein [Rhodoferax sp.]|nr:DUF2892 domain-containing protein [Rhodoferax sp.]
MALLPPTTSRVTSNTAVDINRRIRKDTEYRVDDLAAQGTMAIRERLQALEEEWDIERCLETGAASLILTGSVLGLIKSRLWFLLPFGVGAFLLQHALQGWCPPLPLLRQLGVRTAEEINEERTALKTIRGDFYDVSAHSLSTAAQVMGAVRR